MPLMLIVGTINRYQPPGRDWRVVHVDASSRDIWDSETRRHVPIDLVADMRWLPFGDRSVDRIQCWHALEHVDEAGGQAAMREFRRVLAADGELDLKVPNLEVLRGAADIEALLPLIYGDQTPMFEAELNAHRWGYTPASLWRLLEREGFSADLQDSAADEIHFLATPIR